MGLNLCPFAKRELARNRVRFTVSDAITEEHLLQDLQNELQLLEADTDIETTLLIHPQVLLDFYDYNQFLDYSDGLLKQMDLVDVYQVASFHPHYQFFGTPPDDVENYTNKSPYPLLHLLRQDSLAQVIANYPDSDQIPERNIAQLKGLGLDKVQALFQVSVDTVEE